MIYTYICFLNWASKDEAKIRLIWKIFLYGWKISKIGKSVRFLSVSWLRWLSVTGYGLRSQWIWRGKWNMHWPVKMFPFLVLGFPTTDRFIWSDASRESSRKLDAFLKAWRWLQAEMQAFNILILVNKFGEKLETYCCYQSPRD